MIVTVTLNPAIDKTIVIDAFVHGGLNRIKSIECDTGGKGINVSKTLQQLGGTSIATGFLAGTTGDIIERDLQEHNIPTDFIHVEGETRINTKIIESDGTLTELNEPGAFINLEHVEQLLKKLESYASENTLFVLAGSVPKNIDISIYKVIIEKVHVKGACVLLDADGEAFIRALEATPDIVKPNRFELEQYFENSRETETLDSILLMGQKLLRAGISTVVVSMGEDGAYFMNSFQESSCELILKSEALSVQAQCTVGAGDAMVAALAYGWEQKLSFTDSAALCMATSAGAVTTKGTKPPTRKSIDELLKQVKLIRV